MKLTEVKAEDIEKNVEKYDGKEFLMTYKNSSEEKTSTVIRFYLNYKGVLYFYFVDECLLGCDSTDTRFEEFDKSVWKDSRLYIIEYDDE